MQARKVLLVVDDDPLICHLLATSLPARLPEFEVLAAPSGAEALRVMKKHPLDLLLTDLMMPHPDGFALLAEMANSYPWVPVAVMTSRNDIELERRLSRTGMVVCLHKPLDLKTLPDLLRGLTAQQIRGELAGITVFSMLTLLNLERKTTRVVVRLGDRGGVIDVREGELWDAKGGELRGLDFVYEALRWDSPELSLMELSRSSEPRGIHESLPNVLQTVAQRQTEARARSFGQGPVLGSSPAMSTFQRWRSMREGEGTGLHYLAELVRQNASGELVASSQDVEVHVNLGEGRTLWATSSAAKANFLDRLVELGGSAEELRTVLQECRRARLPLLETLLEWNVVESQKLEAALRWQVLNAVRELAQLRHRECVFLRRAAEPRTLSFDTSELLVELDRELFAELAKASEPQVPDAGPSVAMPPSTPAVAKPSVAPAARVQQTPPELAQLSAEKALQVLQDSNPKLSFVELRSSQARSFAGADTLSASLRWLEDLQQPLASQDFELLAARRVDGALIGRKLAHETRLWTVVEPADFNLTMLGLMRLVPLNVELKLRPAGPQGAFSSVGLGDRPRQAERLASSVATIGVGLRGAWVVSTKLGRVGGLQRSEHAEEEALVLGGLLNTLVGSFTYHPAILNANDPPSGLALMTQRGWWFAVELGPDSVLWMRFALSTPQGLGWMYLHQVRRELGGWSW